MKFNSGKEMLDYLYTGNDLYSKSLGMYVFHYSEAGSICWYSIDEYEAEKLSLESKENGEYWGAFLGWGGSIVDPSCEEYGEQEYEPIDFCNENYMEDWIDTNDYLKEM